MLRRWATNHASPLERQQSLCEVLFGQIYFGPAAYRTYLMSFSFLIAFVTMSPGEGVGTPHSGKSSVNPGKDMMVVRSQASDPKPDARVQSPRDKDRVAFCVRSACVPVYA